MIVIGADATGACEKFPSHVPCAFVTIPVGEIVEIFSLLGDGTFKTGATLQLKIGDEHTWHAVAALRRDMIKKWFDVDEAVFLPPRTITVSVPRYTTIYDTSDAGEGTCSLSCTTGDTQLHVGDRIGLHHGGSERVDHKLWITPERMKRGEGIDGTIDRNRYVVKIGSQCHGAMPKTFAMPVSSLEFLKDVPPDCSFDAQLETSNSEISGVTMTSNNYKGLKVRVLNVNSGDERIRVYTDAGSTFINGKRDIKKTMDIVYKQQEMAMQNRFGINQQIFINTTVNNNIIVRSEDDPYYVVMLDGMLDYAKARRLTGNGKVYEPIEYCPCAYRALCDYEEYVNKSLKHNPETYKMLRMHPSRGKSCVEYMRFLTEEESMPQYTVDKDLLSFSNGVLRMSDMRFVPYDGETSSVMGKVARHHVDCDYTASTDTPIIDKILETNFDEEVASMFYAMVGRLIFEVGKHDDWQVMPYMIGVGGTGKSVLLNTITSCFAEDAVGNLSSKREEVFGSANIFDKEVVVGCDMPAEMSSCIPQVSFQSMTSGDRLEIPRKKEKALFIKWTTPIIIASNYTPDYKETGDNIGRRIVSFRFDVAVPKAERDYGLKAKIMETGEIANFIHRALVEYDALRKRIRGDFWTAVPPIMIDWQSRLAVATNKLHEFLSMDNEDRRYNIEHIEGATTPLNKFKTAYSSVMRCMFEKDAGVFQRFGFLCPDTRMHVCKSCSKVSAKGCCAEYSATNRTQRMVIVNMKLSSDGDEMPPDNKSIDVARHGLSHFLPVVAKSKQLAVIQLTTNRLHKFGL
eukprot:gene13150-biopygen2098